jgi:hypothetical protein
MRLLPIIAAASIGLFASAAFAQNMNTADPNSAPGASPTGGRPSASTTGQRMDTVDKGNPNRPGKAMKTSKKKKKMKKSM